MTNSTNTDKIYDVMIIGGGPGGYAAALYSSRAGLSTVVFERLSAGGQIAITDQVDNYPGFDNGIGGFELGEKMKDGAERFGAESIYTEVTSVDVSGAIKKVETKKGTFYSRTLMIATGADPRMLGVPGEKELMGRGVSYCATCDGMFYRGRTAVVVGGGNTAVSDAILLSRVAEKVILVHHSDKLTATKIYHDQLMAAENVEFHWDSEVTEILHGDLNAGGLVEGVTIKNIKTGETQKLAANGVFIAIGRAPLSQLVEGQVELDKWGYIIADESTKTNVPGVFAIGDVRTKALRQVITAASDGATASHYAEEYILEQ